jgi:two-component system chemotaxis response regulator CheB
MGVPGHTGPYDAIVIGASFGGPPAIEKILTALPRKFPTPIAICQHISPGFTAGWADRLNTLCSLKVVEIAKTMQVERGRVYVAPAGFQTRFTRSGKVVYLRADPDYADSLYVPSIDQMMTSASRAFGSHLLGVLLTGLGNDGSAGMLAIREMGGYTIAEAAETAASDSMPSSAARAGAVIEQLPLPRIIDRILEFAGKQ